MQRANKEHLDIVMIGAGNVAHGLAKPLQRAGHKIVQICSRGEESAKELADIIGCNYSKIEDIFIEADLYILAIPDAAIKHVSNVFPKLKGIVVHTSGSTPVEEIAEVSDFYGVFYPFQTFSKGREVDLNDVPFCIETNCNDTKETLFMLADQLGGKPLVMNSENRQWLHLSGVFACNFANHMLSITQILLENKGVGFDLIRPLVKETISKAMEGSPLQSQTGPAVRGDSDTIKKHVALLSTLDADLRDIYMHLSTSILNLQQNKQ